MPRNSVTPQTGTHATKAISCPCLRLKKPVERTFALPTFPDHHLLACPLDSPERARRWLRHLDRTLAQFRDSACQLCDENNLIVFPLTIPYDRFLPMEPAASLAQLHNEICHLTRKTCLAPRGPERDETSARAQVALHRLLATLDRLCPAPDQSRPEAYQGPAHFLPQVRGIHAHCLEEFSTFLRELLEHGISQPWLVERCGDHRACPLGRLLHSDEPEALGAFAHVPEIQRLQSEHLLLHETAFVMASEAQALRLRPLCQEKLPEVEARLRHFLVTGQQAAQALERLLPAAVIQSGDRRGGPCRHSLSDTIRPLTLGAVLDDLLQWKEKMVGMAVSGHGSGIEKILPPSATLLGQRLTAAMENQGTWRAHAPVLQRLYTAHTRMHGVAIRLFALAQAHHLDEARSLIHALEQAWAESDQLTRNLAGILGLTPGREAA